MNRPGPTGQPMRGLPGFPGQQPGQSRTTPLGSGRLQNGKISNASNWGFGMQTNGAPGLPTPVARAPGVTTSFAQTIGGSQPATPLDLSEFPSLSGTAQPQQQQQQQQNPGQAIWANANQARATQQTPVQRPQQSQANTSNTAQPQQRDQVQQSLDEAFSSSTPYNSGLDDYRNGGQSGVGQLSGSAQTAATDMEEFPPLGQNAHGEIGQDARGNLMHNAASGAFPSGSVFGAPMNQRSNMPTSPNAPADGTRATNLMDRMMSPAGLSPGGLRSAQNGLGTDDKGVPSNTGQNGGDDRALIDSLRRMNVKPNSTENQSQAAQGQSHASRLPQSSAILGGDIGDSPNGGRTRNQTPLSQMSELDRFGLPGLLDTIRNEDPDITSLAIGHDLTQLGLDLNSSEPLWPTWGGPFALGPIRPMQPDFTLPTCYTVHNVHKLEEKVPSFSDETLFYIFYTLTRDIMQEVAAYELTARNWRYHKVLKVWLTKDPQYGDPTPVSPDAEHGRYVVFNEKAWQRESRVMTLRWQDLDDHIQVRGAGTGNMA